MTLKQARQNKGLVLVEVAAMLGVIPNTIWNWESGRSAPTIDRFNELIAIYGVEYQDIEFPIKRGE